MVKCFVFLNGLHEVKYFVKSETDFFLLLTGHKAVTNVNAAAAVFWVMDIPQLPGCERKTNMKCVYEI